MGSHYVYRVYRKTKIIYLIYLKLKFQDIVLFIDGHIYNILIQHTGMNHIKKEEYYV